MTFNIYKLIFKNLMHVFLFMLVCISARAQQESFELPLPKQFNQVSINARALSKSFGFDVNESISEASQNLVLDQTGFILHLAPISKIKKNTSLKIISDLGEEVETFKFIEDDTLFGIVDPEKTYSIVQEVVPSCEQLKSAFALESNNVLCPDKISFKILEKIMISKDTSLGFKLKKTKKLYLLKAQIPENTEQLDLSEFNYVQIGSSTNEISMINVASLLETGKICFLSAKKKTDAEKLNKCSFQDKNIKSIIMFSGEGNDFTDIDLLAGEVNFLFPYVGRFNKLLQHYIFEFSNGFAPEDEEPVTVDSSSLESHFFAGHEVMLNLNLGNILTDKTKIAKKIFSIDNAINIDRELKNISFQLPLDKIEGVLALPGGDGRDLFFRRYFYCCG